MQIRIGLENNVEGRSLAWVLDHPGCFAYGKDGSEAIVRVPQALLYYKEWIDEHTQESWLADLGDFDIRLVEAFDCYSVNENFDPDPNGYEVNAWFRNDWKPLKKIEIEHALQILAWSRLELFELTSGLSSSQMDQTFPQERWSIRGVMAHIAHAESWYMDKLGLAGDLEAQPAADVVDQLNKVRLRLNEILPTLENSKDVRGLYGEFWSARKILRRSAWHEKDHILHIQRLMSLL